MEKILFDSRCELDKLPGGAVTSGTRVKFGIRCQVELLARELCLVVIEDVDGSISEFPLEKVWSEKGYDRFEGSAIFEAPGLRNYYFKLSTPEGEAKIGRENGKAVLCEGNPNLWQQSVYDADFSTPQWILGGAFYHIFVDRFCRGGKRPPREGSYLREDWGGTPVFAPDENGIVRNNDFFGGDLDGVIQKLPYLQELGVTCIYLSPIFEAASNHKYDTGDYMKIDPAFGDDACFEKLCAEAKALGISVICDGVFNHSGDDSLYFNRSGRYGSGGAFRTQASPYYPWYNFSLWPQEYAAWWGIKTLPQLNGDNPGFREFIFGENGVLKKWMRLGASGWRLDVADELSEGFIRELRNAVKEADPEALIIGEVWEDASNKISYGRRRHYFDGAELDSVMNYPFKDGIIDYVKSGNCENLCEIVESICENYPKPALDCLMNGLGTHDTGRILTVLGGKSYDSREQRAEAKMSAVEAAQAKALLRLASVLQCTLPGVPCVYYGDEAGLEGYEDPFNRRCYPWGGEDCELVSWYRALLNVRRDCPAFAGGSYRTLHKENGFFAFIRKNGTSRALSLINLSAEPIRFDLRADENVPICQNCLNEGASLLLNPQGCAIIVAG
ncbi:MAG: glycoside hydrolase family 13 protein [Oscillospiraceae bacterium]